MRAFIPDHEGAFFARGCGRLPALAEQDLRSVGANEENLARPLPNRAEFSAAERHDRATVVRAPVDLPGALAELARSGELRRVLRARHEPHVPRALDGVAPHHGKISVRIEERARVTALADRFVRRFVDQLVLRPRAAGVFGTRAPQLRFSVPKVEPRHEQFTGARAGEVVQTFVRAVRHIVDRDRSAPGRAAVRRSEGD